MRNILILLAFCFSLTPVSAQNKQVNLSGYIFDKGTNTPVEQTTIQLLSLPDSTFVKGTTSRQNGAFELFVRPGKYILKLSFIGYTPLLKALQVSSSKPTLNLGKLYLEPDAIMLNEAVVTAQAAPVVIKGDTTEYSASAYRTAEGAMLEELVKKLPGAEVDNDGKITINGKEIKKIMVDGKEFFSDDPKVSMKNLPVDIVDKVKAYDKKSDAARITGIEDGEDETVLDLTVKKGMKKGWVGNLIAGYGTQEHYELGAMVSRFRNNSTFSVIGSMNNTNSVGFSEFGDTGQGLNSGRGGSGITSAKSLGLNYAFDNKKLRINSSVQYGYSDNDSRKKNSTETFIDNAPPFSNSENRSKRQRHDARADLKIEWRPDTMSTLIFRPVVRYSNTHSNSYESSDSRFRNQLPVNDKVSQSSNQSHNYSVNGRLQYFRRLNNNGRNFSVNANFGLTDSEAAGNSLSQIHYYTYNDNGELEKDSLDIHDRKTNLTSGNLNYSVSASYAEPILAKKMLLQLEYEYKQRNSESESRVYGQEYLDSIPQGYTYADSLSNGVTNTYGSHNIEVALRGNLTNLFYYAGVNFTPQFSKSNTHIGPNANNPHLKQRVVNFAPSLFFRYLFTKQHSLTFRYNGQSNEPDIESLQEIIDVTDPLDLKYGNPGLKPSFSNSFSLYYNKFVPDAMRSFSLNLFFSNRMNSIVNRIIYNSQGGKTSYKDNINGNWNTGGYFTFNTPLRNKKYTLSSSTNPRFNKSVGYANVSEQESKKKSAVNHFTFDQRLMGNYRTEAFDISLFADVSYNLSRSSTQRNSNRETFDYTFGGDTNINLPWGLSLSTNIGYHIKRGYSSDFNNNEIIWNGQISKNLLKNKATIRVKVYDILQQETSISRNITDLSISDTEYNTLGSYVMVHFVYRLNTLGKRGAAGNSDKQRPRKERSGNTKGGEGRIRQVRMN